MFFRHTQAQTRETQVNTKVERKRESLFCISLLLLLTSYVSWKWFPFYRGRHWMIQSCYSIWTLAFLPLLHLIGHHSNSLVDTLFADAEIWLILMLMLKCCEKNTVFHDWKVVLNNLKRAELFLRLWFTTCPTPSIVAKTWNYGVHPDTVSQRTMSVIVAFIFLAKTWRWVCRSFFSPATGSGRRLVPS